MEMTSNPPASSTNREQPPSGVVKAEERTEKNTTSAASVIEHKDPSGAAAFISKDHGSTGAEFGDTEETTPRPQRKNEKKSSDDCPLEANTEQEEKDEAVSNEGEKRQRHRAWSLGGGAEGIEIEDSVAAAAVVTKKIKVNDDRDIPVSSPIRRSRDQPHPSPVFVATGWPQRSPMDQEHPRNRNGGEHRCQIDEEAHASANGSSSSPSREEEQHQHDEVAHALFTESFDTISACASVSAMGAVQETVGSGVLSPRQKTHTPTDEETIGLLSPRHQSRQGSYGTTHSIHRNDTPNASSQHRYNNPSLETREDDGHRHRRYHEDSPHSPPQRIVHVDGDDNGCGDISPIKFSPPTESHRDHHRSSRYQGESPSNMNTGDQFCKFISTPATNDSNEQQQHAVEVSFDTSAAGNHSYRHKSEQHRESSNENGSRKRRANDNVDDARPVSYSTSTTLSEAKTPPRRGTGRAHSIKEVGSAKHARSNNNNDSFAGGHPNDGGQYHGGSFQSLHARAPPIPRDIFHPHYAGGHYRNPPPVPGGSNLPPGASASHKDQTRDYFCANSGAMVRNAHSGRTALSSSPIRPSQHSYQIHTKQDSHRLYRDPTPHKGPPPFIGGPWMGHGYSSEPRGYPPPRARLSPPHNNTDLYWNQHQNRNPNQHHSTLPTIPTHGHPKGRLGTAPEGRPSAPRSHQHQSLQAPPYHHHYAPTSMSSSSATLVPGFTKDPFDLLRSIRKVFEGCSYLLYPAHMGVHWGSGHQSIDTNPEDLKVARRRIESAICALGGYVKDVHEREESPKKSPTSSSRTPHVRVFRRRMDCGYRSNSTSIVCSNSTNSSDYYRDRFHHRYFIGDHGVSWDVEENPPVFVSVDEDDSFHNRNVGSSSSNGTTREGTPNGARMGVSKHDDDGHQSQLPYNSDSFPMGSQSSSLGATPVDHNQKMKYRCKLCGQPKQNHVCPYRKSLVRTLGIMVCPAVNSYTSAEPGVLTPALSEMNNFVPYGRSDESSDLDTEVSSRDHSTAYNITPGGSRKWIDCRHYSPASSSLSASPHSDVHRSPGENQYPRHHADHLKQQQRGGHLWHPRKTRLDHLGPLFMALALRPEHYRAVTSRTPYRNSSAKVDERDDKEEGSFEYPHIPLTFLGRKRLTDTLFYLSQSIPSVTADVASLLRMARERDEWDLAVAEVLTQVVVCIHCSDGDYRLNGLKSYLLKIGIAA